MAHVLQVLEATIGGTRRHLRDLTIGLSEASWRVSVAAALARDPGFARDVELFRSRGIAVHPLPMVRRPAPLADLAALHRLRGIIAAERPSLIHAHSSKAGMLARLAARHSGIPVVYTPHCFAFEGYPAGSAMRSLYRGLERRAIPLTTRLIAVSRAEQAAARALGYPDERIRHIPCGIPPAASGTAEAVRGGELYDAAFIGRFCRQKGIDLMIDAIAHLAGGNPDLRFAVMGGGGSARLRRRLAALRQTTVLPFGEPDEVAKLLRQSRVLACPSRWEGLPYLLLEAMSLGTAVVTAGVGGVGEVVADGREALVIPPGDAGALARGLSRLLEDPALRERLAAAARVRVADFSLDNMISATAETYIEILGRSG